MQDGLKKKHKLTDRRFLSTPDIQTRPYVYKKQEKAEIRRVVLDSCVLIISSHPSQNIPNGDQTNPHFRNLTKAFLYFYYSITC
jgi:hypothetical protein